MTKEVEIEYADEVLTCIGTYEQPERGDHWNPGNTASFTIEKIMDEYHNDVTQDYKNDIELLEEKCVQKIENEESDREYFGDYDD